MMNNSLTNQSNVSYGDVERVRDRVSLFGAMNTAQLIKLLGYANQCHFEEGDVIFEQGQLPGDIYILLSGKVDLGIIRDDFSKTHLTYVAGDCFGETSVIGIQSQMGKATVEEDAQALVLSRFSVLDMLENDSELFGILMMNIAREVSRRLHFVLNTATSVTDGDTFHLCH